MKILVTGGAGFIGTHLCGALIKKGNTVTVLDLKDPKTVVPEVRYVRGDVRIIDDLVPLVNEIDCVYHLAAIVSVPICQKEPSESYKTNFFGTLNVLEAIRNAQKQGRLVRVAFSSTSAIYGELGNDRSALKEDKIAEKFLSFYAAQKYASEQAISLYNLSFGIPAMVFRFFNVFGIGQDPSSPYSGVISLFTKHIHENRSLQLNSRGETTRDFVSVKDVAKVCASILALPSEKWIGTPINLGTGCAISIKELAEKMIGISGKKIPTVMAPHREGDVMHSKAEIEKARRLLGFDPKISLE